MKKFVFLLMALIVFSGCLVQPQVTIKSAKISGENVLVEASSNKKVQAEVQLSVEGKVLCSKIVSLKQGNNSLEVKCNLTDSTVTVTIFAEGAVFSKEIKAEIDESSAEELVFSLVKEKTLEGELLSVFEKNLSKTEQCASQKFVENTKKAYELMGAISPGSNINKPNYDLTQDQLVLLEGQLRKLDDCYFNLEKKLVSLGNKKYSVDYFVVVRGASCPSNYSSQQGEAVISIEVDLKDNSVKVTKGAITANSQEQIDQTRNQFSVYNLMGECLKYMMLGITLPSTQLPPVQSGCTGLSGNFQITQFGIQENYIILHVKNTSDQPIELTGFAGSPVTLGCSACPQTIAIGQTAILNLQGAFAGQGASSEPIREEITISYSLNKLTLSEMVSCTARIGEIIENLPVRVNAVKIEPD